MICRNFIVKSAKRFSEYNAKNCLKIPFCNQEILKPMKIFYSVLTSMAMFTPNQSLSNFVVSQKFKPKSEKIRLSPCQNLPNFKIAKSERNCL